jgi:hypothetical protein
MRTANIAGPVQHPCVTFGLSAPRPMASPEPKKANARKKKRAPRKSAAAKKGTVLPFVRKA